MGVMFFLFFVVWCVVGLPESTARSFLGSICQLRASLFDL